MNAAHRHALVLIALVALAAGSACSNHAHLVTAKPLATGQTRTVVAAGGYVRTGDDEGGSFTTDLALQHGVTDWLSLGVRAGFPHGVSVNGLFNLYSDSSVALSIDPMLNLNWWYMEERYNHVRAELPVLVGILLGGGNEITLGVGYGVQAYLAGGDKITPATGQYVTGQVSARISVTDDDFVAVMPYIAYTHFVRGKRLSGSQKLTFGLAFSIN